MAGGTKFAARRIHDVPSPALHADWNGLGITPEAGVICRHADSLPVGNKVDLAEVIAARVFDILLG